MLMRQIGLLSVSKLEIALIVDISGGTIYVPIYVL